MPKNEKDVSLIEINEKNYVDFLQINGRASPTKLQKAKKNGNHKWASSKSESLYCSSIGRQQCPKCICGENQRFLNFHNGYLGFCSVQCKTFYTTGETSVQLRSRNSKRTRTLNTETIHIDKFNVEDYFHPSAKMKYPGKYKYVFNQNELPHTKEITEFVFCILNAVSNIIKCNNKGCVKSPSFIPSERRYREYCSRECQHEGVRDKRESTMFVKYGSLISFGSKIIQNKSNITKIKRGVMMDPILVPDWEIYHRKVMLYTKKANVCKLENYDKRGRCKYAFHLDHRFSISEGFKLNILPHIIGDIDNLQMIPSKENMSKGSKCSISITELYKGLK